ncbi:agouti signaling protein 1 isoform X9 [Nerophis ophidion]|uniref:agouti signaling protein 1 isoform X9 n=1 Tax=Nerophis ophidion TaxID=159077 RepID=UPI002ADFE80B|nr:agouti signaling protein 1 isoform X9 [Nerophis ophidion]
MHAFLLLGCVVFATSDYIFGSAHMMIDDRLSTNKVTMFNSLSRNINPGLQPPVVIVELAKPGRRKRTKKVKKAGNGSLKIKRVPRGKEKNYNRDVFIMKAPPRPGGDKTKDQKLSEFR